VDSRDWAEPAAQFLRLTTAEKDDGSSYVIHDMAYTQSNQLREAVALCFDEPAALKELDVLSKAEICYSSGHHMTAVWLAAWLANRLDLKLNPAQSSGKEYTFERNGDRGGTFQICLEESDVSEGGDVKIPPIVRVTLRAGKEGARFDFIRSDDGKGSVFWRLERAIPGRPETSDLWPIRSYGDVGLVNEILMRAGRNRMMDDLLPLVRSLLTL